MTKGTPYFFRQLFTLSVVFVMGCASNQLDRFDKISEGMDKDAVLEILGSPTRTEKSANQEKWAYVYYPRDNKEKQDFKFVRFINGKVTAFGEDEEEIKRLQILKEIAEKKEALRKKKAEVDEKVEKGIREQKAEQ